MLSTRQMIIELLQQKQTATAAEISRVLRVTTANIRHHLSILLVQGVVLAIGNRPAQGRGRPAALYALTQAASQHNLSLLSASLLDELFDNQPAQREYILQHLAERMAGPETANIASPTRRMYWAIERLNQMHYQAHWEARADAPRLTLGHCPYTPILGQHPELCDLDCYLIYILTGMQPELIERLALTPQGMQECPFILRKSRSPSHE